MKTGEIWKSEDLLILIGKRKPKDMWTVAPFGGFSTNLKEYISYIRSDLEWVYNEISGEEIRKRFHKVYEEEL